MEFAEALGKHGCPPLRASKVETLQVNIGYKCNMSCKHCHVQAGPSREEIMQPDTMKSVISALAGSGIKVLDITGGAPELNPHLKFLIEEARALGCHVMVRSNLTVYAETGMEDMPVFYRDHEIELVASLPYYRSDAVDRVRGEGVFEKSISALRVLNNLGFGIDHGGLKLDLVHNPQGMFFPPCQARMEEEYRRELDKRYGVSFSSLFTLTNMPLGRFRNFLVERNQLDRYMERLRNSFNPAAVEGVMCRSLINVGWDGTLYDCDFNQMLGLSLCGDIPKTIDEFDAALLSSREIAVSEHCFGCTAGQGSSCQGAAA
ncbi:MAG TPA: arsenosugar biosynthesis radical SAM (seleno)protein ArsS [Dissulfurispiraceae bacterium]|nr:arsenosugar biosynthesis radical SAM (seleno)protein ArsS [Dissulfurispiraceae bacterium]